MTTPRRYTRVLLGAHSPEVSEIVGALAEWPTGQVLRVFDLSYNGVALERERLPEIINGETLNLRLHLGGFEDQIVPCLVIWQSPVYVGLQFLESKPELEEKLGKFLQDKFLGLSLKQVPEEVFLPGSGFSHWFHGPMDTNLYLWMNDDQMDRAWLSLENNHFVMLEDRWMALEESKNRKEGEDVLATPMEILHQKCKPCSADQMRRILDVLSQVQAHSELTLPLMLPIGQALKIKSQEAP